MTDCKEPALFVAWCYWPCTCTVWCRAQNVWTSEVDWMTF